MSAPTLNLKIDRACIYAFTPLCHPIFCGLFARVYNEIRFPFWLALLPGVLSCAVPHMNGGRRGLIGWSVRSDLAARRLVRPAIQRAPTHKTHAPQLSNRTPHRQRHSTTIPPCQIDSGYRPYNVRRASSIHITQQSQHPFLSQARTLGKSNVPANRWIQEDGAHA
jgi:hypothetical protein